MSRCRGVNVCFGLSLDLGGGRRNCATVLGLGPARLRAVAAAPLTLISLINSSRALFVCYFSPFPLETLFMVWGGGGQKVPCGTAEAGELL